MAVTEALERHWRDALAKERLPRPDAEQKMFANTPLADRGYESDPTRDLGWLPAEEYECRRLLRMALRDHEEGYVPELGAYSRDGAVVTFPGGVQFNLDKLHDQQRRKAYNLFRAGASVAEVSHAVFRPREWCEALKEEFGF